MIGIGPAKCFASPKDMGTYYALTTKVTPRLPRPTVYKVHLHSMLQTQQGKLQIDGISTAAPSSPAAATITTESQGFLLCQRQAASGWRPT